MYAGIHWASVIASAATATMTRAPVRPRRSHPVYIPGALPARWPVWGVRSRACG
jgi:hypothetical protein